jgi:hypothetical protein
MKHQYKLTLLAASLVTAFAANVAVAGNIQSSSVQIAREVITDDSQTVVAPMITYTFQGDVDASSQDQTFQVQLQLTNGGAWASVAAGSVVLRDSSFSVSAPRDGVNKPYDLLATPSISADGKTLYATFTVKQGTKRYTTPVIQFNPNATALVGTGAPGTAGAATVATGASSLKALRSVVGEVVACDTKVVPLPVTVLHFTGVTAAGLASTANGATPDEHVRNGQNSTGTLLTFPTNVLVTVKASTGSLKIDPATGSLNTRYIITGPGTTGIPAYPTTRFNMGTVTLSQNALGYDSNLINQYMLADPSLPAGVGAGAAKVSTTATRTDGPVEAKDLVVTITSSQGYAGSYYLTKNANCDPFAVTPTQTITGNTMVLSLGAANVNAAFGPTGTNPIYICNDVSAVTSAIPPSTFSAVAVLSKASGTLPAPEQNNSCNGPLYPLSGGVKVDVRNYATSKTAGNWMSVIRLINPSETNTATVFGQLIHADGSYGGWGQIATLAPRAVTNMTSSQIDALLVNAPATNGAGYVGGAIPPAAQTVGDRLRVTADGVSSLRVQNYLYNPDSKNFIEASSTQGVDFEGSTDRAPLSEGQYQDQDAQRGLAK